MSFADLIEKELSANNAFVVSAVLCGRESIMKSELPHPKRWRRTEGVIGNSENGLLLYLCALQEND